MHNYPDYLASHPGALLNVIADLLWPDGDEDASWDADTLDAIGDAMTRGGYHPFDRAAAATCGLQFVEGDALTRRALRDEDDGNYDLYAGDEDYRS